MKPTPKSKFKPRRSLVELLIAVVLGAIVTTQWIDPSQYQPVGGPVVLIPGPAGAVPRLWINPVEPSGPVDRCLVTLSITDERFIVEAPTIDQRIITAPKVTGLPVHSEAPIVFRPR